MNPLRAILLACVVAGTTASAETSGSGYAELRGSLFTGVTGDRWLLVERLRPTFEAALDERVKLVSTLEVGLAQGRDPTRELQRTLEQSELGPLFAAQGVTWPEHANPLLGIDGAGDYLRVDRLYADLYAGKFDIRVGRQALNWGSAQGFNPTDPFPEVLVTEPWRPRSGVNALRVSVPFGALYDVSALVATNDRLDDVRAAGRLRLNWSGTDLAAVATWRGKDASPFVGVDLRGTLEVGWWFEGAYFFGRGASSNPHVELAAGVDYSFPVLDRLTVFAQYYRNGAGDPTVRPMERLVGLVDPATARRDPFAPFTAGRDYAMAGSTLAFSPELSATLFLLQNLNDGSALGVPTVSYAVRDWLSVSASAQVPYSLWGRGGELHPRPEDLQLTVDAGPELGPRTADLSGLNPSATFTVWSRANF